MYFIILTDYRKKNNSLQNKILSKDAEKVADKIQHPFFKISKPVIERNILNLKRLSTVNLQ